MDFNEWNKAIIAEFRANEGRVGGQFEGTPIVLLSTTGAKSGKTRVNPLVAAVRDDDLHVFASMGGAPRNPDWYHNLVANPSVTVEYGTETFEATAVEVKGAERDAIWAEHAAKFPNFAEYAEQTKGIRTIPVIELRRNT